MRPAFIVHVWFPDGLCSYRVANAGVLAREAAAQRAAGRLTLAEVRS